MIGPETLFILGAGASKPYGFPTGGELRAYICKEFPKHFAPIVRRGTKTVSQRQKELIGSAEEFAEIFKHSSIPSIEQFLALNPELSDIGKIASVSSILRFERSSRFRGDMESPSQDWYSFLYRRMTEGFSSPDSYRKSGENGVSFITFNYDRSLEDFLFVSLTNSFWQAKVSEQILLQQEAGRADAFPFCPCVRPN